MDKWYVKLVCFLCIVVGIFSIIMTFKTLDGSSQVVGKFESIETANNLSEVAKFDFVVIDFQKVNNNINYSCIEEFKHFDYNGDENNYYLLFNDCLISNVEFGAGVVKATLKREFKDTAGDIVTTANVNILIEFLADKTIVSCSMQDENNSLSYFVKYMNLHGAILKVVKEVN